MPLLEIRDLSYYYPQAGQAALSKINLSIDQGEFLLLVGSSGSGKSTLARSLCRLIPDFYGGRIIGDIKYKGRSLRQWDNRKLCREIGIVFQDPGSQIIYGNVERDIAFGLENLGLAPSLMNRRVAEMLDFLSLGHLRDKPTTELSGGEKQKVALAGVLAMNPQVLILDEPTSQLDPIAAEEFLGIVKRINEEMGTTIIMVEQRLNCCFPLSDQVVVMEAGSIVFSGSPCRQVQWAVNNNYPLVPSIPELFAHFVSLHLPLTVKEGKEVLKGLLASRNMADPEPVSPHNSDGQPPVIEIRKLGFAHPGRPPLIRDLSLRLRPGETVAVVGANGAGKSTLLKLIMGILKPDFGQIKINGLKGQDITPARLSQFVGFLPQDSSDFFIADSLAEDIRAGSNYGEESEELCKYWLERLGLEKYMNQDPRKLSAGESQKAALAIILAAGPQILLLDEPTTGVDCGQKKRLGSLLKELASQDMCIVLVTHDIEFAAEYADRIIFLHEGRIMADGLAAEVLEGNIFYSPPLMRLFHGIDNTVINRPTAIKIMETIVNHHHEARAQ